MLLFAKRAPLPSPQWISAPLLALWLLMSAGGGRPASAEVVAEASSSRHFMHEAQQAIPFDKLTAEAQTKIWDVVSQPSIYRRMPAARIECDPQMYLFLMRHPEVVVNIWQLMGITAVTVNRTGPYTLQADDGAGTQTGVELIYGTSDTHVILADGFYKGALIKNRIHGKCVLLLRSEYHQAQDRRPLVTSRLDVFVKLENAGAELVAKTIFPLVARTTDYNFTESTNFLEKISQAAQSNGPGVQRMARRLEQVDPAVRQKFAQVSAMTHQRAANRFGGPARINLGQANQAPRPLSSSTGAAKEKTDDEDFSQVDLSRLDSVIKPRRTITLRR